MFLLVGFLSGIIFDVGGFIKFLCSNKKAPCLVIDFISTLICLCILFFANLFLNYGQIRLFPYAIFLISFSLERFTLGMLLAKMYLSCYNTFNKILNKLKKKNNETDKNG